MPVRTIDTYPFETKWLLGEIRCYVPEPIQIYKPGVVYLLHKGEPKRQNTPGYDLVPEVPRQALLMPEYLMKPHRIDSIFWKSCRATAHTRLDGNTVVFSVAADQTSDWDLSVDFRYTPGPDWIDFEMRLMPNVEHDDFDLLIASYITEDMESTWIPAFIEGKEVWRKLDNRNAKPFGRMYGVPRDEEYRPKIYDGRYGPLIEKPAIEAYCYSRPIIVSQKEDSGLACVIMVEPEKNRILAGQKHWTETAHDFTFSGSLVAGELFTGRARLVVRNVGSFPSAVRVIDKMWDEFQGTTEPDEAGNA